VNIRPATQEDVEFLQKMLYEAARWNPDWPREPMEEVLAEPMLTRFHEGWGRPGDAGVIAELDGVPVGAAWYRLFTAEEPGYGFVDEKIPEPPPLICGLPFFPDCPADSPPPGQGTPKPGKTPKP